MEAPRANQDDSPWMKVSTLVRLSSWQDMWAFLQPSLSGTSTTPRPTFGIQSHTCSLFKCNCLSRTPLSAAIPLIS